MSTPSPSAPSELPPPLQVSQMIVGLWVPQAVHAAAELGIADALADGPLPADALAARLGTHPDATERLLRALATLGLLAEEEGRYAPTALGRMLQAGVPGSRRAWSRLMGGREVWDAWGRLTDCVRTGAKAFGSAQDTFEAMDADVEGVAVFHQAMADLTCSVAPAVARAIDCADVRRVVDLGGGYGALLCALLEAHPHLQGVVFDLAPARAGALELFVRRGLDQRARYVAGSFFDAPPPAADLFVLKSVIHDWDDERALAILRQCFQAMTPGQRLVLVEPAAASAGGGAGAVAAWFMAFSDLNMLVTTGGRERTAAEYSALLQAAGLSVTAVRETGTMYQVFESTRA